ncbi:DUF6531 domain-containing protein [Chitinimonas sp. PSY-7]|uniref:DUF6531 domain-containing protein n=1 Tax=Chitinimonas sp. PSY-7 TaxID=3459088 RepID=UPI0040402C31
MRFPIAFLFLLVAFLSAQTVAAPPDPRYIYVYKPTLWHPAGYPPCQAGSPSAAMEAPPCKPSELGPGQSWSDWTFTHDGWNASRMLCTPTWGCTVINGTQAAVGVCPRDEGWEAVWPEVDGKTVTACRHLGQCVAPKEDNGKGCVCPKGMKDDGKGGCIDEAVDHDPINFGCQTDQASQTSPTDVSTTSTASTTNAPAVAQCGNPIQPATGNKYQQEVDYLGVGANRLAVVRHYNSKAAGWRDANFKDIKKLLEENASWRATRADGKGLLFPQAGGTESHGTGYSLQVSAEGVQLTTPDNTVESYDLSGRLLRERQRDGYTLTYGYNAAGKLTTITDTNGRVLTYTYDAQNRIETIKTPSAQILRYGYNPNGWLASVTYPDGKTRQYLYENGKDNKLLTGIKGEDGVRFATWTYDDQGRAISSEHGNGLDKVTLAYSGLSASSTSALGLTTAYTFQNVKGYLVLLTKTESCPGCTSTVQQFEVEASGLQSKLTDRRGIITKIESDLTRLLETRRIEAEGAPQARTISTEWHPTLRLPTKIIEPTRRREFTYDGAGNLTNQTMNDLSNNSSRSWRWSYDAQNRLIDSTDAAGRITRYTYDAAGNLASMGDAVGTTRYTQYNPDGLPLSITQPNGAVITLAYDSRGRLISQKIGTLTTTYGYTVTGLLSSVATPDGNQLTYTYDDAHRLIVIRDKLGNSVRYVLDAAGNRIEETVQDANGGLSALIERIDTERSAPIQPTLKAS